MKKTLFLIPGFTDKPTDKKYRWLASFLKSKGFRVVEVPVDWEYRTNSECAEDFKIFYRKNKSKINYVLGFSYGAVIAFLTAAELKPDKLFLCSLSPDFKEDAPNMKPWIIKYIGKRRFEDAQSHSARSVAKHLLIPVVVFYGEREAIQYPDMKKRAAETARLAKRGKLIVVPKAPHDISHAGYRRAIKLEF